MTKKERQRKIMQRQRKSLDKMIRYADRIQDAGAANKFRELRSMLRIKW